MKLNKVTLYKKVLIASLLSLATTSVFATIKTIKPSNSTQNEVYEWTIEKLDDGMIFNIGQYTKKLLIIRVNETVANGAPADPVIVSCNASNEDTYRNHRVEPGSSLICKGNFHDFSYMSIEPKDFKHGSLGTYTFQPVNNK